MTRVVLALDAATEHIALGIAEVSGVSRADGRFAGGEARLEPGSRLLAARDFAAPRAALGALVPEVRALLDVAGFDGRAISAVAVGRGPGSFTGVRIAVTTAKGLARGWGVPLAGFGTLDAVAWRMASYAGLIGVVGDAMRGEVYPCRFRVEAGCVERLDAYRVCSPLDAAREWRALGQPLLLTGNGLVKYAGVFADALGGLATFAEEAAWAPDGASVIAAALAEHEPPALGHALEDPQAPDVAPAVLLPVYTRLSDAEEAERVRAGREAVAVPRAGVAGDGSDA